MRQVPALLITPSAAALQRFESGGNSQAGPTAASAVAGQSVSAGGPRRFASTVIPPVAWDWRTARFNDAW